MTREEAVIILDGFKNNPLFSDTHVQALDMAISALSENKGTWRHYEGMLYCPKCGAEFYDEIMEYTGDEVPKHCPDCGADMRGET